MNVEKMERNAKKMLLDCCGLKAGENVMVLTDDVQDPILAEVIFKASIELGAEPILFKIQQIAPGGELPLLICEAAKSADLIVGVTSTSTYHCEGFRVACLPPYHARMQALSEWVPDTMENGGIEADFKGIAPRVKEIAAKFHAGKRLKLTTPAGTCLEADIEGRFGEANTGILEGPCQKMGIPTIEAFVAPTEDKVNGHITVDGSCSGGVGLVKTPIEIEVVNGKAVSITGGEEAAKLRKRLEEANTPNAYQIAEIAVGMNPNCRMVGVINEDEGKYGTCHCALGNNTDMHGFNYAPLHIDMVQWKPTLEIDGELIFKDGECLI